MGEQRIRAGTGSMPCRRRQWHWRPCRGLRVESATNPAPVVLKGGAPRDCGDGKRRPAVGAALPPRRRRGPARPAHRRRARPVAGRHCRSLSRAEAGDHRRQPSDAALQARGRHALLIPARAPRCSRRWRRQRGAVPRADASPLAPPPRQPASSRSRRSPPQPGAAAAVRRGATGAAPPSFRSAAAAERPSRPPPSHRRYADAAAPAPAAAPPSRSRRRASAAARAARRRGAARRSRARRAPMASHGGRFPWPVRGRVLAGYGGTAGGAHNDGINIAAPRGTPVRAVDAGTVAYAGNELRGYGNLVLIKHANGWITAYAHCDELLVKRGDTVAAARRSPRSARPAGSASRSCISSCAAASSRSIPRSSWRPRRAPASAAGAANPAEARQPLASASCRAGRRGPGCIARRRGPSARRG